MTKRFGSVKPVRILTAFWSETDAGGLFSAGATAGTATVTASSGGKSGTASVTVTVPGALSDTLEVTNANAKYSLTAVTSSTGFRGTQFERFNSYNCSAWVAVDAPSTSITYSGTWSTGPCTTTKSTSVPGSYAQLVFTGTGIRLYDATDNDDAQSSVHIDGVLVASPVTGLDCSAKIFERTGM